MPLHQSLIEEVGLINTVFDAGRQRWSWAVELGAGIINAFPEAAGDIEQLRTLTLSMANNPNGGLITSSEGQKNVFVWGDIQYLSSYLSPLINGADINNVWDTIAKRNFINYKYAPAPRIVIHAETWTTVTREVWNKVSASGANLFADLNQATMNLKKADIFIITSEQMRVIGLSVKSGTGESEVKLSQQSTSLEYAFLPKHCALRGGLQLVSLQSISRYLESIPESDLHVANTSLSPSQFNKLNRRDKVYAVIKNKYPREWNKCLDDAMKEATDYLTEFSLAISGEGPIAQHNLRELLKQRLVGGQLNQPDLYQLWISGFSQPINLSEVIGGERSFPNIGRLWGEFRTVNTSGKVSLVIYAESNSGEQYTVCKIEPGFDGGRANVSQTKGIIYYFQEGRQLHLPTVWDLIEHTWANIEQEAR